MSQFSKKVFIMQSNIFKWAAAVGGLLLVAAVLILVMGRGKQETPQTPTQEEQAAGEEQIQEIALSDVTGGTSQGTAQRLFAQGLFLHGVEAQLPDVPAGQFYEGWLVRGEQGNTDFQFVSTGKMEKQESTWTLLFTSQTDYTAYNGVVITRETTDDGEPEVHILEGSF